MKKVSCLKLFFQLILASTLDMNILHTLPLPPQTLFSYDLGLKIIDDQSRPDSVMICCHGYGHNSSIVKTVQRYGVFSGLMVGFNFPDHDITAGVDHRKASFGTINELLPLLYLIKYYACDCAVPSLSLYGFSAGGGAVVNALAVLQQRLYSQQLQQIGIFEKDIPVMLQALRAGSIILDCPLKSMEEIIAYRGMDHLGLSILAAQYAKNNMNPIDTVLQLAGLNLTILLYFENPDEILSNRDDALFIDRLKKANGGNTFVAVGNSGGHNAWHTELWQMYRKVQQSGYSGL
jgi:hypothetical protein